MNLRLFELQNCEELERIFNLTKFRCIYRSTGFWKWKFMLWFVIYWEFLFLFLKCSTSTTVEKQNLAACRASGDVWWSWLLMSLLSRPAATVQPWRGPWGWPEVKMGLLFKGRCCNSKEWIKITIKLQVFSHTDLTPLRQKWNEECFGPLSFS